MSYQSEERYWSDYLRIALPIAGLLLLLGVFWYWANSFIGDDETTPPRTPEVAVQTTPLVTPTFTPEGNAPILITNAPSQPTQVVEVATEPPAEEATEPAGENGSGTDNGTGGFAEGQIVIVNDNDVNMREDPTTSGEIVDTLANGTELRILDGESVEANDFTWWNVEDTTNEVQGWVAEQFLEEVAG